MGIKRESILNPALRARIDKAAGLVNEAAVAQLTSDNGSPTLADARLEKNLSADVQRWLKQHGYLFLVQRGDRPSSGARGWSDYTILLPGGQAVLVELKNARGRLSPWQTEFARRCSTKRIPCFTCRSLAHVQEVIKAVERIGVTASVWSDGLHTSSPCLARPRPLG